MKEPSEQKYAEKMSRIKASREKMMSKKQKKKGLIIVYTGKGKGKTTAGFGMIFRHIAWKMPCAVVQFIKGGMETGERELIIKNYQALCPFYTLGEGFTWETQDRERDKKVAQLAWEKSKELIRDSTYSMVLLDEIIVAMRYDYLDVCEVVQFLKNEKPPMTHVVLTGRNAKAELLEIADLATEMNELSHPFRDGIMAQQGIEY